MLVFSSGFGSVVLEGNATSGGSVSFGVDRWSGLTGCILPEGGLKLQRHRHLTPNSVDRVDRVDRLYPANWGVLAGLATKPTVYQTLLAKSRAPEGLLSPLLAEFGESLPPD